MHVKKIKLIEDYRNLPKGLTIKFKPINLLVGEQGCGKSSLLGLLQSNDTDYLDFTFSEEVEENGIETFFFDTEKMNPRTRDVMSYTNPDGTSRGIGIGGVLQSHFMSHGEVLKKIYCRRY